MEWIIVIIVIGFIYSWIKALVEIGRSNFKDQATKVIWFVVVFFMGLFGLLAYYMFGRNARNH